MNRPFVSLILTVILSIVVLETSARVEVVSTTCQSQDNNDAQIEWMTCPMTKKSSPPKTFREFEHYKNSKGKDRKFCCGELSTRFCCTFDEKIKEFPDFDPNTHEDPEFSYLYKSDWHHFGFWNGLLVTATVILVLGLMLYMISCIFVEIFEMIIYVLCCCFKKKKSSSKNNTKEYRPNERASLVSGVSSTVSASLPFVGTNRNAYQNIDGRNYLVQSSPSGGQPSLYQNVTESARAQSASKRPADAPPAYEQLA